MIRVLVVEDSPVTLQFLVHLIDGDPALTVVGEARDGVEAVEQAERHRPDVIVMDVHMPRLNGFDATRQIMARAPAPIVIISASLTGGETARMFEAIKAGALTAVPKPAGPDHPDHERTVRLLLETVKLMAEVKVVRRWPRSEPRPLPPPIDRNGRVRMIAIGASTGGPAVVSRILAGLPGDLGAPILLVQHIATGFTRGLAEWLGGGTQLAVKLAQPGETPRPGSVYVAPDDLQMGITPDGRIRLAQEPALDGFRPSVSHLFRSASEAYGPSAMGILLTGMGRDGAEGLLKLRETGGVTIAQDEQTSIVFGMPKEAVRLGAARYVLAPDEIVGAIRNLVNHGE